MGMNQGGGGEAGLLRFDLHIKHRFGAIHYYNRLRIEWVKNYCGIASTHTNGIRRNLDLRTPDGHNRCGKYFYSQNSPCTQCSRSYRRYECTCSRSHHGMYCIERNSKVRLRVHLLWDHLLRVGPCLLRFYGLVF
jgi:hypothetical protein